ncbi:hypothetical protein GGX14DRAFT_668128 [Mycena pura]|uniref:Uncharacterized protein n=1 Tax=Mycena pura TaxID=153505 RepID=A0AAD6Y782_9AGAR|nr:hypothetical protein GGX14DRAFT_668128 [Mycena pura]
MPAPRSAHKPAARCTACPIRRANRIRRIKPTPTPTCRDRDAPPSRVPGRQPAPVTLAPTPPPAPPAAHSTRWPSRLLDHAHGASMTNPSDPSATVRRPLASFPVSLRIGMPRRVLIADNGSSYAKVYFEIPLVVGTFRIRFAARRRSVCGLWAGIPSVYAHPAEMRSIAGSGSKYTPRSGRTSTPQSRRRQMPTRTLDPDVRCQPRVAAAATSSTPPTIGPASGVPSPQATSGVSVAATNTDVHRRPRGCEGGSRVIRATDDRPALSPSAMGGGSVAAANAGGEAAACGVWLLGITL